MRHLGPTRPDRTLHEKLHTMFRSHVVPFQHISETTASSRSISEWTCRLGRLFVNRGKLATVHRLFAFPSRFGTAVAPLPLPPPFSFSPSPFLLPLFDRLLHGGNRPETTLLFLPRSER